MGAFYLGERRFRLTNKRHAEAPYIVTTAFTLLEEQREEARGDFHLAADGGSISIQETFQHGPMVSQVLPLFDFLKAMQTPCTLLLQEQVTGVTRHIFEGVQLPYTEYPHVEQLVAELRAIQDAWPELPFHFPVECTYEKGEFLNRIATIIRTGREEGRMTNFTGTVLAGQLEAGSQSCEPTGRWHYTRLAL